MNSKSKKKSFFKSYEFMLLCVVVVLMVVLSIVTQGKFIKPDNLIDVITSYSAYGIITVGCLFVIISGGIDISFMAVGAVAQYLAALYMLNNGGNFVIIYVISIVTGMVLGFGNAILVNKLKVPTLIITIATMNIIYGLIMKLSGGVRLHGFPKWFSQKTDVSLFCVAVGTLVVVLILAGFILKKTKIGREIYAIGGNMEAAKRCGVNVLKVHMFVYGFAGAMAGLGALVKCYLSQQAATEALYGNEMDVLSMVVLGGVSLSGGKGNIFGTVLGIILIGILSNGMILMGVSSYWQKLVIGIVILISFCITGWRVERIAKKEQKGEAI
ncbi:MAG: ABC transporter permease [Lachnospiraceae bacterium]|nr:ABC transporter permease [Lachnospiraceae bacterium]